MKANKEQEFRFSKAVDLMHRPGSRLMIMHTNTGDHFYVVPGGRVNRDDAQKILKRPDVIKFDDGLSPGHPQSWKLMR